MMPTVRDKASRYVVGKSFDFRSLRWSGLVIFDRSGTSGRYFGFGNKVRKSFMMSPQITLNASLAFV